MPPSRTEQPSFGKSECRAADWGGCIQFPVSAAAADAARQGGGRRGWEEPESPEATSPTERLWVRLTLSVTLREIMRD